MSKTKVYKEFDITQKRAKIKQFLENYWYDQWMSKFIFKGLTEDELENRRVSKFLMNEFWDQGQVAAFRLPHDAGIGLTQFAIQTYNYLTMPETVRLINKWNVSFIPATEQRVNKDVTLGYAQYSRKPVRYMVLHYIEMLVDIEMVINTNLCLQKIPFLIGISPEEKLKAQDLIDRILNDEIAVIVDVKDLDLVKALVTNAPYILDKLYAHKQAIEGELKTYLGVDNTANDPSKEFQLVDEINSNNGIINANEDKFKDNIQNWIDDTNKLFGTNITIEVKTVPIQSVYDDEKENDPNGKKQVTPGGNNNDN